MLLAFAFTVEGRGFKSRARHVKNCYLDEFEVFENTFKQARVCNMNLDYRLKLTESVNAPCVRWYKSVKS